MLKISPITFAILLLSSTALFAETVEFEGRYWFADIDAKIRVEESGIGDEFDLKSDLGIDNENLPEGIIYWHTGPNSRLRLTYIDVDADGDETVTRAIQFSGQTFTAGTRVVSDFEIQYLRFGWIWQFLNCCNDKARFGTIIEAKAVNTDMSLNAPALGISESEEFWAGLPTAGLAFDIQLLKILAMFAEFSGLPAGETGYFFDAEAGIKINPVKYCSIIGGYRIIKLKAEDSSDFTKVEFSGPFAGVSIKF